MPISFSKKCLSKISGDIILNLISVIWTSFLLVSMSFSGQCLLLGYEHRLPELYLVERPGLKEASRPELNRKLWWLLQSRLARMWVVEISSQILHSVLRLCCLQCGQRDMAGWRRKLALDLYHKSRKSRPHVLQLVHGYVSHALSLGEKLWF